MYKILMRRRRGRTTEKLWLTDITLTPVYATVSRAEFQTEAGMDQSGDPPVGIDKKENAIHIVRELFGMYHKKSTTFTIVGHGDSWTFHRDQMYASKRARLNPVKGKGWTVWIQDRSGRRYVYEQRLNDEPSFATATNFAVKFETRKDASKYAQALRRTMGSGYTYMVKSPSGTYFGIATKGTN